MTCQLCLWLNFKRTKEECGECSMNTKPTNPKDAIGSDKLPLHLWPTTATAMGCIAMLDGALKYGRSNFRASGVRASIYHDAAKRHLDAWFEGEDCAPDSGVPHLAHALACIAILIDAKAAGKLNDDRMVKGGYKKLVEELSPHVARLKALYADKEPKHYTISDEVETSSEIEVDSDGWIEWYGGECPVPEGTLVDVKHRDGTGYLGVPALTSRYAEDWSHTIDDDDIMAYRVVENV